MSLSGASADLTVHDAGEAKVLAAILHELGQVRANAVVTPHVSVGPGDDCAVFFTDGQTVVTTDAMVEDVDFSLAWSSGFELGWKLAATNLSDIAAMGAIPRALTVTVFAPDTTLLSLLREVARGLAQACAALAPECAVVGGDLSSAEQLSFSATAIGEMRHRVPVLRSGAKPGDVVAYAGELGLAASGLALLAKDVGLHPEPSVGRERIALLWQSHPEELAAQLAPSPPIPLGPLAADAGCTAMMDVSDALSLDAARLGDASNVSLNLDSAALTRLSSDVDLDLVLGGGEDHGLLATFASETVLPQGFQPIGVVEHRSARLLLDSEPYEPRGWDPFQRAK